MATIIKYECNNGKTTVEIKGDSQDVFKGLCRIIANIKAEIEIEGDKSFDELLLEGVEVAEKEKKLNELKRETEDELIKMLKELVNG